MPPYLTAFAFVGLVVVVAAALVWSNWRVRRRQAPTRHASLPLSVAVALVAAFAALTALLILLAAA